MPYYVKIGPVFFLQEEFKMFSLWMHMKKWYHPLADIFLIDKIDFSNLRRGSHKDPLC